jgi:hypothetical protein
MATKTTHKNNTAKKIRFFPVAVLKNGILQIDGHMVYYDKNGNWLYVSEDGQTAVMYGDAADMIKELFKRNDNDDFVVIGWEFEPYRFVNAFEDAYRYYNERFD